LVALVAILLSLNYLLLAGVNPKETSANPYYQCEQGQNLMMLAIEIVVLATGAWSVWTIDSALEIIYKYPKNLP
jgi:hypothetical protein